MEGETRRVAVVIPALNEEAALPKVLAELPLRRLTQVVVVDNGSSDATARVARQSGATVLSEPNRGYGRACLAGIDYLKQHSPEVVVFLDGDYSDYPDELDDVVRPILEEGYDFVIGSRSQRAQAGALLFHARFGNALATGLIRSLYGFRYTDLGPFRAIRFEKLLTLDMQDKTYGWTVEMQIKAVRHGLRITEVPVRYRPRIGQSKVSGTLKGSLLAGYKILWTVLRYAKRRHQGDAREKGRYG